MNVLICTPVFHPSVGGLETINVLLAQELVRYGWKVVLVTPIICDAKDSYPFQVVRCPGRKRLLELYKWCDVFVHNAIVLKYVYPALLFRKPFVVVHHSCTYNWNSKVNYQSIAKRLISLIAHNITVSEAVAKNLKLPSDYTVINNFYDSNLFRINNRHSRAGFVYVGRLSYEKGVSLLLKAYSRYLQKGGNMSLTIVGGGYQQKELEQLAVDLNIDSRVYFAGIKRGVELRDLLNEKRTLVLPSICNEAFGIVVLEAMACGCYCIGSDGDGIQEAMGNIGHLFKKADADSLATAMLESEFESDEKFLDYCVRVENHLQAFTLKNITERWIAFLERLV